MGRTVYIYGLYDPRDNELRYIGKTCNALEKRLRQHLSDHEREARTYKNCWLSELLFFGLKPTLRVLRVVPIEQESEAEIEAIAEHRRLGCDLTNSTTGGEGLSGMVFSEEHRAKIAAGRRGHKHSKETCARLSEMAKKQPRRQLTEEHKNKIRNAITGKKYGPPSQEHKDKIANALKGRPGHKPTAETRLKMSVAAKKRKASDETKLRMSLAHSGKSYGPLSEEHKAKISATRKLRYGKKEPQ